MKVDSLSQKCFMVDILGKKCKMKLIPIKKMIRGTEIDSYKFEIQDEKFMQMIEENFKNYMLFLPQTPLRTDLMKGKTLIFIDAAGFVTQVSKS
jgi:hypothetical protein